MKLLIVDDDPLIREGLRTLLLMEKDVEQVDVAVNGQEAVAFCQVMVPDVIIMDIRMPIMDGVTATKEIKRQHKGAKIIILTTFNDQEYLREACLLGAEGYILKSKPADQIIENIRFVNEGHVVFEKEVSLLLKELMSGKKEKNQLVETLTDREVEIISLISEGLSNKEIGTKLFISEGTVRNSTSTILNKLNLRDRTQLAIFYMRYME